MYSLISSLHTTKSPICQDFQQFGNSQNGVNIIVRKKTSSVERIPERKSL